MWLLAQEVYYEKLRISTEIAWVGMRNLVFPPRIFAKKNAN